MRSGGALLPAGANGLEILADVHFCRAESINVMPAIEAGS
jgi:hypothetical protein